MQTLNDVICWYENRQTTLIGKATREEMQDSVLHYLKEYQRYQNTPSRIGHMAMVDLEDNPPLTWDELRQMKGKPVWVERYYPPMEDEIGATEDEGNYEKFWAIIDRVNRKANRIHIIGKEWFEGFGEEEFKEYWQAYRKERS